MAIDQETERCSPMHRRQFLAASAAAGATLFLPGRARGASVHELQGNVTINGKPATTASRVRAGDVIETGPDSKLVFALGQDAFLLRERSVLKLERPTSSGKVAVASLRLETGALLAAFGKGSHLIETRAAAGSAGTRNTAVYIEARAEDTYFCTCYGAVELRDKTGRQRRLIVSSYHTPNLVYAQATGGRLLAPAPFQDHTDAELIMLDSLVGRTSPIQSREQKQKAATAPAQPEPAQPPAPEPAATQQPTTRRKSKTPPAPKSEEVGAQPATSTPSPSREPTPPTPPQAPPDTELRLPPARLDD